MSRLSEQARTIKIAAIVIVSLVLWLLVRNAPPMTFGPGDSGPMVTTHLLLELFSVMVSVMVAVVAWHSLDRRSNMMSPVLFAGFVLVAGLDLVHALSIRGMPDYFGPNSTSKAIFFWLCGRFFELLTMLAYLRDKPWPGSRASWCTLPVLLLVSLVWLGNVHLDWFPQTFVEGDGVTPFKADLEYLLTLAYFTLAGLLLHKRWRVKRANFVALSAAAFLMGMTELMLSDYQSMSDLSNVLGHLFKLAAYSLVFYSTLLSGLREPYQRLARSERMLSQREREMRTIMRASPIAIAWLDGRLRYRFSNAAHEKLSGLRADRIMDRHVDEVLPPHLRELSRPYFQQALSGQAQVFNYGTGGQDGAELFREVRLVTELADDGTVQGVLMMVIDITEQEVSKRRLQSTIREIDELNAALDAHAIVALTDARGIITRVNDKFCSISQYARPELIGQNHRIINSGYHPKSFFNELWRTISSGKVWTGEVCNRAKDGSLYWVYSTIVPVMGASGRPEQYIAIRADITERKRAEEEARRLALHDSLTGLANRRLLDDRTRHAIAKGCREHRFGALLILDLDHFKAVNDTLGHAIGDLLLQHVAARILSQVRATDTVARLGGDEFVVVLEDIGAEQQDATRVCADVCEKIRASLAEAHHVAGHKIMAPPSIGTVLMSPASVEPDELLKQADMALYKAKSDGRNCVRFFDPALQQEAMERSVLMKDLHQAIMQREFALYYQPVVNAEGAVQGLEALIRWRHPRRGLLQPGEFIPLAEQSNLILAIGQWVLEAACQQISAWQNDPARCRWTVAVNVSARQFHEPQFVEKVEAALRESGAPARQLRLEITEGMLQQDLPATIKKMQLLRAKGVRFALDDFGTGYSSLSYLKELPLDQLKIDKSFSASVHLGGNDAEFARVILALARIMELDVVAEGIEAPQQLTFLIAEGCHSFQGYYFSRPVPVEQLPDMFAVACPV